MANENNENVGKMLANFIQKTNLIARFQIFTKRTHAILFGISVFTACYTTFSFFMHKNMVKLDENMMNLKYLVLYNAGGIKETGNDILNKIEEMIDKIEEHDEKLDEYKNSIINYTHFIEKKILVQNDPIQNDPIQNVSVQTDPVQNDPIQNTSIDASTQTEPFTINQYDELENECYDIILCRNIKKYHFI
jgi:hypothetical protein